MVNVNIAILLQESTQLSQTVVVPLYYLTQYSSNTVYCRLVRTTWGAGEDWRIIINILKGKEKTSHKCPHLHYLRFL